MAGVWIDCLVPIWTIFDFPELSGLLRQSNVRGTRVLVRKLFDYLKAGYSLDRFLEGFPTVDREMAPIIGHHCQTCRYAGLKGLTNGKLLAAAEKSGFHALITVDKNVQYQQSFDDRGIGLMMQEARTTNLDDLLLLVPEVLTALDIMKAGDVGRIRKR